MELSVLFIYSQWKNVYCRLTTEFLMKLEVINLTILIVICF